MNMQERLLDNLNRIMRNDEYIQAICKATGLEMDEIKAIIQEIYKNLFFDTMTWGIEFLAKELDITFRKSITREEKISIIKARLRSQGKVDAMLLQSICDSWHRGSVAVSFVDGHIQLEFIDIGGIPTDLPSLKHEIEKAKPAHLAISYIIKWLVWEMWDEWNLTWDEFESCNLTWDELEKTVTNPYKQ